MRLNIKSKYRKAYAGLEVRSYNRIVSDHIPDGWKLDQTDRASKRSAAFLMRLAWNGFDVLGLDQTDRTLEYSNPSDPTQTMTIEYFDEGEKGEFAFLSVHYFKNDKYHRRDGPALIKYNDYKIYQKSWYINDKLHREDGPADIKYYNNGKIRTEEYYINDKLHREDGPAVVYYYPNGNIETEGYFINDLVHREDGPAEIKYGSDGTIEQVGYFIHNKQVI